MPDSPAQKARRERRHRLQAQYGKDTPEYRAAINPPQRTTTGGNWWENLDPNGTGSGTFAPPTFLETAEGQAWQAQQQMLQLQAELEARRQAAEADRQFQMEQARLQREAEERMRLQNLTAERANVFTQTYGEDPVRAILLGKGLSPDITGGGRFGELAPLEGIGQRENEVEAALRRALGSTTTPDINEQGITGLPSVQQVARQVQFGGDDIGTLLRSAFGVGNRSLGGGVRADEFMRQIQDVTPTGAFAR